MAPGSALLSGHPKTVNLREEPVVEAVNGWIRQLVDRQNIDATVTTLLDSHAGQRDSGGQTTGRRQLLDAEARIRRFQDPIGAGVDPAALIDPLNRAQTERAAAQAGIDNASNRLNRSFTSRRDPVQRVCVSEGRLAHELSGTSSTCYVRHILRLDGK